MWPPLRIPDDPSQPWTDYSRWRLHNTDDGAHLWEYLRTDEQLAAWPQTSADKYWAGIPLNLPDLPKPATPLDAARNGYEFYKHLQANDGHWAGEYGGPMFLLPGFVIGSYVTGMSFKDEERLEMIRYIINHTNDDGGIGLHIEGPSTCFGTSLNYIAMRLLGLPADHPAAVRTRAALHKMGGAISAPSWGKFWMSILNVYDWEGNNPIPAELWLLPDWVPFHPSRWWVHCRIVFTPMSYLYGIRFTAPEDPLILALREELYVQPYDAIDWPAQRNNVWHVDLYQPHSRIMDFANVILKLVEPCMPPPVHRAALARVYEQIVFEDENTGYQTIGPVSKMMNLIARAHVEGRESDAYKCHERKRQDFLWLGKEGMMVTGTNGSQLWDIGFITQALVETGLAREPRNRESLVRALQWLDQCQIREDPPHHERNYRHRTKGAWPFSTREQGFTVSDCTGEGLKSVLYLQNQLDFTPKLVSEARMRDAVDTILSLQNADGGFASYELVRGSTLMELLNPAEVFGKIMVEYEYAECTTSAITALSIFRRHYPDYRAADIERTIRHAIQFMHAIQKPEGGWYGSWGISFTYATMFALESLALGGETYQTSAAARRACDFLVGKQRADGGWGESFKSCELESWVDHEHTQVVGTCWATLALMYAQYPDPTPIARAVRLVMARQLPDGSWPQEAIEGIFNNSCAISYPNFKFAFTIWMLGRAHGYLEERGALGLVAQE
ncbi:terpene synthase [Vararia minispora EC-137]|uniref:Terpene synthase n=1 Tax=Vararia minispora EC-137 TaxID=1314806 RepID=A0ACB8QHG5_9AGAM|nr:terpene synthase [Vararia minispora EC-137]